MASFIDKIRLSLAHGDALPQLAFLGVIAGLITSMTILLFRLAIETPLNHYLENGDHENFEALAPWIRFFLPLAGALFIASIFARLSAQSRMVGIAHVLERIKHHQGHMPFTNFLAQFFAGMICVISGQSAGREGPAVHLGAATGSIMGRQFELPSRHIQLLLASGVAAAISASFNTPIAGVIFAMEVIVMGFNFVSLIPVILASVTGALVSRWFYGTEPAFMVPPLEMRSLLEFPFLILQGLLMGALAALFIFICVKAAQNAPKSIWLRFLLIGLLNGTFALFIPAMMGIGYDTVNQAITGHLPWMLLLAYALGKLCISGLNLGLGQPAGVIGPMLFIGACAGAALGEAGNYFAPDMASANGYYAMLGMAAMMSACLQAPLTALMTLLELTNNPNIILPAMLVVVIANLTASEIFKQKSLFPRLLQLRGLTTDTSPVEQMLRQNSVLSVAEKNIKVVPKFATIETLKLALNGNPVWLVIHNEKGILAALAAADAANLLMNEEGLKEWLEEDAEGDQVINLMAIPGQRLTCKSISMRANLQEALDVMIDDQIDCLTIHYGKEVNTASVMGIIEHDKIHNYYRYTH